MIQHLKQEGWGIIHPKIVQATKAIIEIKKFDEAIFIAFRYVEAEIQSRINSKNIGVVLLNEAFDSSNPKIRVSDDTRDQEGIKNLFQGAMTNIRNDRGHKKSPSIPCVNYSICLQYLAFASLLLYLLDKDKNSYPYIESCRVFGSSETPRIEIIGRNFIGNLEVITEDVKLQIVQHKRDRIEVIVPDNFSGNIQVLIEEKQSNKIYCDTLASTSRKSDCH